MRGLLGFVGNTSRYTKVADAFILAFKWFVSRFRILIYEPVQKLQPLSPSKQFDKAEKSARIAVHIHLYYLELMDEMIRYSNHIPYRFDCYISTDTPEKETAILKAFQKKSRAQELSVQCFPNQGRDIASFLIHLSPYIQKYDYICHIHTKCSFHNRFGDKWRKHMLESLLATPDHIAALLDVMEKDEKLGIVFQRTYWRVKPSLGWKDNRELSKSIFMRLGLDIDLPHMPQFPAGDFFWARTGALSPVFAYNWHIDDFPLETRQTNNTLAHALERCWALIAQAGGYGYKRIKAVGTKNGSTR